MLVEEHILGAGTVAHFGCRGISTFSVLVEEHILGAKEVALFGC